MVIIKNKALRKNKKAALQTGKIPNRQELARQYQKFEEYVAAKSKYPLFWKVKHPNDLIDKVAVCPPSDHLEKISNIPIKRPRVNIEIISNTCGVLGSLTVMLYSDCLPKTCDGFLNDCRKSIYKNCNLTRIFPELFFAIKPKIFSQNKSMECVCKELSEVQRNGVMSHGSAGVLSVSKKKNLDPHIVITFKECPVMDSHFIPFGKVINGMKTLERLKKFGTNISGYPLDMIWITDIEEIVAK